MNLLTPEQVAAMFPVGEGEQHLNVRTVLGWIRRGVGGVKLKAARAGSRLWIRREDLDSFLEDLSEPVPEGQVLPDDQEEEPPSQTSAMTRADKELERHGL